MAGRWSVYLPLLLVYGVLGLGMLVAFRGAALSVRDPRVGLGSLGWLSSLVLICTEQWQGLEAGAAAYASLKRGPFWCCIRS